MLTLEDMAIIWTGAVPFGQPVGPSCLAGRRSTIRHLLNATYQNGRWPRADEVTRATIWRIQRYGREIGLANGTINTVSHNTLSAMFRDFEEERLLPRGTHAALLIELKGAKRLRVPKIPRERALTREERDRFLDVARETDQAPLFLNLFLSGMRIGEACGLQQRSMDWKRRLCTILFTRTYRELGETKTETSERVVRFPRVGIAALTPLRLDDCPKAPLHVTKKGRPIDQANFRLWRWYPVAEKAGFPDLTPHHARHTFATICLERGVKPAPLAAYLGHSVDVLLARYGHVLGDFDIDEAVMAPGIGEIRRVAGAVVADLGF